MVLNISYWNLHKSMFEGNQLDLFISLTDAVLVSLLLHHYHLLISKSFYYHLSE